MDGVQRVPIDQAQNANGIENRRLANERSARVAGDLEFEPRAAGQSHFRTQTQQSIRFDRLDPPEIDDVALAKRQRAPRLALAIKAAVDRRRQAGRFLLTGSASVMALPKLSESLAGRMELHTLWPFSQGELIGQRETFVSQLFSAKLNPPDAKALTQREIVERLIVGGYPEAQTRTKEERRHAWFDSYLTAILQRDVRDLVNIDRLAEVPRLLALLGVANMPVGQLCGYRPKSFNSADDAETISGDDGNDFPGQAASCMVHEYQQAADEITETSAAGYRTVGTSLGRRC